MYASTAIHHTQAERGCWTYAALQHITLAQYSTVLRSCIAIRGAVHANPLLSKETSANATARPIILSLTTANGRDMIRLPGSSAQLRNFGGALFAEVVCGIGRVVVCQNEGLVNAGALKSHAGELLAANEERHDRGLYSTMPHSAYDWQSIAMRISRINLYCVQPQHKHARGIAVET